MQKILPVFKNGRFYNTQHKTCHPVLLPSLGWYVQSWFARRSDRRRLLSNPLEPTRPLAAGFCRIVWLGHATFLLQYGVADRAPITVLTDPVFGNATALFARACAPVAPPEQLPSIDYVLISHNHRDHLDLASIRAIVDRNPLVQFLVPLGTAAWFEQQGMFRVQELSWWESFRQHDITATFLPAYHWAGRSLIDYNRSLWGSWLLRMGAHVIYFGGDTAYGNHFTNIAAHVGPIDVALLPIGPCEPAKHMHSSHISGSWALQAFLDLEAQMLVPMHWGTFFFGTDMVYTPLQNMCQAWQVREKLVCDKTLCIKNPGQIIEFNASKKMISANTETLLHYI